MSTFIATSTLKSVIYSDSKDHYENAVLRLLNLDDVLFQKWIDTAELFSAYDMLDNLGYSYRALKQYDHKNIFPDTLVGPNNEPGVVWFNSISESHNFGIAKSIDNNIAWLINSTGRETAPPEYEENYFEGDKLVSGGYGNYLLQADWRIEKSHRQVKEIKEITKLNNGKILDIGCGYGFFRKALSDYNFNHYGLEVSAHAAYLSKLTYNYDTFVGTISDYYNKLQNTFDVVTLFDVIEHIHNPIQFLTEVSAVIKPGGFLIIKTPNIDCPEVNVFAQHYHSFKREHLVYYSVNGLANYTKLCGLELHHATSISHLFKGFYGRGFDGLRDTKSLEESLRGSDIVLYLKKN